MASRHLILVFIFVASGYWNLVLTESAGCEVPTCTCYFGNNETVNIEPNTSGNEALAGVVGGLSSLLLTGGGFGIYMLLKDKCKSPGSGLFDRRGSDVSNQALYDTKTDLNRTEKASRGTNIYRAGFNDDVNLRIGTRGRNDSYENRFASDW